MFWALQEYLLTLLAKPREWSETSSEQASEEGGFMKNPQKSFASFMVCWGSSCMIHLLCQSSDPIRTCQAHTNAMGCACGNAGYASPAPCCTADEGQVQEHAEQQRRQRQQAQ